jgi:hypothetical protein
MEEQTLERATEPFFTTKGVGKGTGLGLSMAHGLAAQSGGGLLITSRKGAGACVELWLPLAGEGQLHRRPSLHQDAPQAVDQRSLRILAVDDDSLVLTNTVALLEDLGHRVISASCGPDALTALSLNPDLDLIVTDH